jgi:uridine kinase
MIIGIAGGTGSGKTTVVKKIMEMFPKEDVALLSQDSYYKDNSLMPPEERQKINFDHPDSIEFSLLEKHLRDLKNKKSIEEPIYSYLTCARSKETIRIDPKDVIIVEGILIFSDKTIRNVCDVKIFVDAPADERLARVIKRDMIERGRSAEMVLERYEKTVKPMHEAYIEPTKKYADIIVPQGGHNMVAIKVLTDIIKNKLSEEKEKRNLNKN